jgi:hypothetical protein
MDLNVFVVIRLCRRRFATNVAREWPFAAVHPLVFGQVVLAVELFAARWTRKLLFLFVFACVTQPVVFAHKLAAAKVARVRSNAAMGVHVGDEVGFTDEGVRTEIAEERFRRAVGVRVLVLLEVPLCTEVFVANVAAVEFLRRRMGFQVGLWNGNDRIIIIYTIFSYMVHIRGRFFGHN